MRWLIFTILLDTSTAHAIEPPPPPDVVFVQTDISGVYKGYHGKILGVTPTHIVLEGRDANYLFLRPAVYRVGLDSRFPTSHRSEWSDLIATYWNTDRSAVVATVQSLPIAGQSFRSLDSIPAPVASTLATLALFVALAWVGYKAYELVIASGDTRRLNRLRLKLEIVKMRSEAVELSDRLNLPEATILKSLHLPLPDSPQRIGRGGKSRKGLSWLLQPFMSGTERRDQREIYRAEAVLAYRHGVGYARLFRAKHMAWIMTGLVASAMYSVAALATCIAEISEYGRLASRGSLVLLLSAIFFVRMTVRLGLKLVDVFKAYGRRTNSNDSTCGDEIIGTA